MIIRMVAGSRNLYHIYKRKRSNKKYEPYPHPKKWMRFIDGLMYFTVFLALILTIPQITKVWLGRNASGLSLISWITYAFTNSIWLLYGIVHKEKVIAISSVFWVLFQISIILGILRYG